MAGCYQKTPLGVRYLDEIRRSRRRTVAGPVRDRAYDLRVTSEDAPEPVPDDATDDQSTGGVAQERSGFTTLDLDSRLLHTLAELGYEEPTPIQIAAIPPLLGGKRPPGRGADRHGQDGGVRPARSSTGCRSGSTSSASEGEPADGRGAPRSGEKGSRPRSLVLDADPRARDAGGRGDAQVRPRARRAGRARLRRPADHRAAPPARARGRHRRRDAGPRGGPPRARVDPPRRGRDRRARRGRRDARHGLRRRPRADPRRAARGAPDGALLRHDLGPDRAARRAAPAAPGPASGSSPRRRAGEASRVRQVAYVVRRADKLAALGRILDLEDATAALVFARTRGEVDDLAEALSGRGRDAAALHGGLAQEQRDRIMGRFRDGALDVLVATDVAARGLDIEHVTHVVNYDVPSSPEVVRPPHRPHRTRGPRGRRDHPGRAARAPAAARHRARRSARRSSSSGCRPSPTSASGGWRPAAATLRETLLGGRPRPLPRGRRAAVGRVRPRRHRARRGQPRGRRGAGRRGHRGARPGTLPPAFGRAGRATAVHRRRNPPARGRRSGRRRVARPRRAAAPRRRTGRRRRAPRASRRRRRRTPAATPSPASRRAPPRPRRGYRVSGWRDGDGRPVTRVPRGAPASADVTRLFVGAGRAAGMRPGDLVGAITNEAGLSGGDIGAIQIADGFSLVDVPADAADRVIQRPPRRDDPGPEGERPARALLSGRAAGRPG